jgi:rare lipoprotein A (peptidoglycan hydrolase)
MLERIVTISALSLVLCASSPLPTLEPQPPVEALPLFALASFYHEPQPLASGGIYDPGRLTAAHRTLPFGTRLEVTDTRTGRSVVVTVADRGPAAWTGRDIDLSLAAAQALQMEERGVILATVRALAGRAAEGFPAMPWPEQSPEPMGRK